MTWSLVWEVTSDLLLPVRFAKPGQVSFTSFEVFVEWRNRAHTPAAMNHFTSVLDDADDDTVAIIIQCHLADLAPIADAATDYDLATELYRKELEEYKLLRGLTADQDVSVADDTAYMQTPNPMTASQFQCNSCLESYAAEGGFTTPCHHFYCDQDLATLFRTAMHDRSFYPPKCCGTEIMFDEVKPLLSDELARQFADKKPELDDRNPMYCSSSTCSSYISHELRGEDSVTCGCGTITCTSCKNTAHAGDCPEDEALRLTLALAEREGWRRCNECKRLVELSIGCYHMT